MRLIRMPYRPWHVEGTVVDGESELCSASQSILVV